MNGFRFEFSHYVPYREVGRAFRPLVTASFRRRDTQTELLMLVDSGADNLVLPDRLRELLDIPLSDCVPVQAGTLHGIQDGFLGPSVQVGLPDLLTGDLFEVQPVFSPWLNDRAYGLLGREPAFEHLRFCFSHADGFGFYLSVGGR